MALTSGSSGTTDLTKGRPLPQILRFALPLVLGTVFQQLYSFADTVIVGRCLGSNALGAVGTTYSLNFLILGFIQGACVGFGIPVAESFGAKDREGLQKYLFNGALLCVLLSVVFTILTTLLSGVLLSLMHTPAELYDDAVLYIRIIFFGIPATVLYNYGSSVLRSMGDSKHPFYFLLAASVLNIAMDYILIVPCAEHCHGLYPDRTLWHGGGRGSHSDGSQSAAQWCPLRALVFRENCPAGAAGFPEGREASFRDLLQPSGLYRLPHGL